MRAKNYANVLYILILNNSSVPEKLAGLSRNGPQECKTELVLVLLAVGVRPGCAKRICFLFEVLFS